MTLIVRKSHDSVVRRLLETNPVVGILGPRQCGKTTLARSLCTNPTHYFDLESVTDLARLSNPMLALGPLRGLVVIDEIQRQPALFEVLRVLVDRPDVPSPGQVRFLVLGSASPHLVRGVSETLAGRIGFVDLSGFDLSEVGHKAFPALWLRGGFPRSFLAPDDSVSYQWRQDFVRTFLERDIPQLGINIPSATLRRFWTMIAHYHGQVWNAAEFARSLGSSEPTARRYLDLLTDAFTVRQLQPWYENIGKRQVKSPKVYVRDSGLLHTLLAVQTPAALDGHPKIGASWEGFVIEQILAIWGPQDAYFWATHGGAELDLLLLRDGKRLGFEIKYADAPMLTKSMRIALDDLHLDRLLVIHPGESAYPLAPRVQSLPVTHLHALK